MSIKSNSSSRGSRIATCAYCKAEGHFMRKTPDKNSAIMCPVLIEKERFQKNMQRERDAREKERQPKCFVREKESKPSVNIFDYLDEEEPVKLVKPVKYNQYDIYGKLIATPPVKKIEFPELTKTVIAKHVATVWNKKLNVDEETKEEPEEVKEIVSYEEEEVLIRILPNIPVPTQRPCWTDDYSSEEEEEEEEFDTHFNDHLTTYFEERNVVPAYFEN